jgi:hypothetical protein
MSKVCKKMIKVTDDGVGAFAGGSRFINQVVDLLGEGLAANPKDPHLPRREEIEGPKLEGGGRQVDLLRKVKGIMGCDVPAAGLVAGQLRNAFCSHGRLGVVYQLLVKAALFFHTAEMAGGQSAPHAYLHQSGCPIAGVKRHCCGKANIGLSLACRPQQRGTTAARSS